MANVAFIIQRMKQKGFSPKRLSTLAAVSEKTLKRILEDGEKAHLITYQKLAGERALNVEDVSALYIDPNPAQPPEPRPASHEKRTTARVEKDQEFASFDETTDLESMLREMARIIRAKGKIYVVAIEPGSVWLTLNMEYDDARALLRALIDKQLQLLGISRVILGWDDFVAIHDEMSQLLGTSSIVEGLMHRDLKPENILPPEQGSRSPRSVSLSDFGIGTFTQTVIPALRRMNARIPVRQADREIVIRRIEEVNSLVGATP